MKQSIVINEGEITSDVPAVNLLKGKGSV